MRRRMQGLMTYMTRLEGDALEKGCQGEPFFYNWILPSNSVSSVKQKLFDNQIWSTRSVAMSNGRSINPTLAGQLVLQSRHFHHRQYQFKNSSCLQPYWPSFFSAIEKRRSSNITNCCIEVGGDAEKPRWCGARLFVPGATVSTAVICASACVPLMPGQQPRFPLNWQVRLWFCDGELNISSFNWSND